MIIRKVILENFRAYKYIEIPFNEGINVIVGKNDVGKSTILEALDIFFGQNNIKIDIEDKNVFSEGNVAITIVFEIDNNKEYLIDSDVRINLSDEYLLNKDNLLEIRKEWDCSKEKLTATSLKTYIIAEYPKVFSQNQLPILKITDLKKLLITYKDKLNAPYETDSTTDYRKRADIRNALYKIALSENNHLVETIIPIDKEDAKNIYNSLETDFPQFALFQSDRENKDNEKDVQDPLKIITKQVIVEKQEELNKLTKELEEKVQEMSKLTIEKLREMNPELANELNANLHNKDWSTLFDYSFTCDNGIPLNKRGSGVRRLILLNFFRAEAEKKSNSNNNIIYAFEEPETSQHADNQKMIMDSFIKIANKPNYQVIITTHSVNLIKKVKPSEIIFIKNNNKIPELVKSENIIYEVANELGTLPGLNSNVAILVEGVTDKYYIENINECIPEYKAIINLKETNIPIFWVGGSNVDNWVKTRPLKNQNIVEFHIYDSDNEDHYLKYIDKINKWENGSYAIQTNLPRIENYMHYDIVYSGKEEVYIKEYFPKTFSQINETITEKWDDSKWELLKNNWKIEDINKKLKELGYSNPKNYLTESLSKKMTRTHLEELGVFDEIKGWFERIKELNDKYN